MGSLWEPRTSTRPATRFHRRDFELSGLSSVPSYCSQRCTVCGPSVPPARWSRTREESSQNPQQASRTPRRIRTRRRLSDLAPASPRASQRGQHTLYGQLLELLPRHPSAPAFHMLTIACSVNPRSIASPSNSHRQEGLQCIQVRWSHVMQEDSSSRGRFVPHTVHLAEVEFVITRP